ncbi:L-type lectin-like domain-containing protein [Porphyridium purpureum]|uniref:L-type lectin-like domain-containing protein n=1 Tax=Porphyridium purpureum TaxID=35688 RepID=A0A5J4YYS0_PORPP|nr:L-type lectin-like domain-containing protein [Porphyridium purpureum]|eukprot:POR1098..scf208_2
MGRMGRAFVAVVFGVFVSICVFEICGQVDAASRSKSSSASSASSSKKKTVNKEEGESAVKMELRSPFAVSGLRGRLLKDWFMQGSATITSDETGRDILELALPQKAQTGMIYSDPVDSVAGFTVRFDFRLVPASKSKHPADGMAFWVVTEEPKLGGAIGISEDFVGLGVIIDSFANSKRFKSPAYAYPVRGDGSFHYSDMRDGADTELTSGCELEPADWEKITISYAEGTLRMTVGSRKSGTKYTCFEVDVAMPGASGALMSNRPIYFAFSAQTGYYFAHHQVRDISIRAFRDSDEAASNAKSAMSGATKPKSLDTHNIYNPDTPIMNEKEMQKQDPEPSSKRSKKERKSRKELEDEIDQPMDTLVRTMKMQLRLMKDEVPKSTYEGLNIVSGSLYRIFDATNKRAKIIARIAERSELAQAALKEAKELDSLLDQDCEALGSAVRLMTQRVGSITQTANFVGHYAKRAVEKPQEKLNENFMRGRHHLEIGGKSLLVIVFVIVTQALVVVLLIHAKIFDGLDISSVFKALQPKAARRKGRGGAMFS